MVRAFLLLGGDIPEYRALNQLNWQRVKGGWLGTDGSCPWEIFESNQYLSLYNRIPSNSTMLCAKGQRTTIVTNYPPFLEVLGELTPNRKFLDDWVEGVIEGRKGLQLDFLKGVFRVPWGHVLRVGEQGVVTIKCVRRANEDLSKSDLVEEFGRKFEDAMSQLTNGMERQKALALSSGLDSMIVGVYLKKNGFDICAYTMESNVPGTDERVGTRHSAGLLTAPLIGFSIDGSQVLRESIHPYWGPQAHPGEVHETEFLRFVAGHGASQLFMGAGADQICSPHWPSVLRHDLVEGKWRGIDVMKAGIGWRSVLVNDVPRDQFSGCDWDLASRHRMRIQRESRVELLQPFLTPEIVEFALSLPSSLLASTRYDKLILRELGQKLCPSFNSFRPKYTHFGPSISSRMPKKPESPDLTPQVWRRLAANHWMREFDERRRSKQKPR